VWRVAFLDPAETSLLKTRDTLSHNTPDEEWKDWTEKNPVKRVKLGIPDADEREEKEKG
jgi:hypothetical protein